MGTLRGPHPQGWTGWAIAVARSQPHRSQAAAAHDLAPGEPFGCSASPVGLGMRALAQAYHDDHVPGGVDGSLTDSLQTITFCQAANPRPPSGARS